MGIHSVLCGVISWCGLPLAVGDIRVEPDFTYVAGRSVASEASSTHADEDECRARMEAVLACDTATEVERHFTLALLVERGNEEARCTAAVLSARAVLTAAHCVLGARQVRWSAFGRDFVPLAMETIATHPSLDVALIEFEDAYLRELFEGASSEACGESRTRIRSWETSSSDLVVSVGDEVSIVGFGMRPAFLPRGEPLPAYVYRTEQEHFFIRPTDGFGACLGDSGAPVWGRLPHESEPRLLGVLVRGASGCEGPDQVVRLAALGDWLKVVD